MRPCSRCWQRCLSLSRSTSIAASEREKSGLTSRSENSKRWSWSERCCCIERYAGAARSFIGPARSQHAIGAPAVRREPTFEKIFGAELEELESYARDLRYAITRLRGRPLRRYKFWMRVLSSRFALGRSLACYGLTLALLIASSCYADPPLWAPGSNTSFDTFVLWQAFDGRLLLANWMAVSFTGIAMPLLYFARRTELSREHGRQIREFARICSR